MADILKNFTKLHHVDAQVNRIQLNIEDSFKQQKLINQQHASGSFLNFSASLPSFVTASFDNRYILTSSIVANLDNRYVLTSSQFTQSITSSLAIVGDVSSSGQGIFNTGYKSMLFQLQLTSTQVVGTVALTGGYYGCTPPWSGSLAGFSLVCLGAQPSNGKFYATVRFNGTPVTASTLTSSNSIVNPSKTFQRGQFNFIQGQALDVNINTINLSQNSAGGATYVGYGVAVWVYM